MRRGFGLLPRDESFFELFEEQGAVLRECLPILAAMREADHVDPNWAMGCRPSSSMVIS
jgi:hypothetical protein